MHRRERIGPMNEQLTVMKKRPRGRPWKPGQSGNPAGRPRGALSKIALAVMEGARRAREELARPLMLDKSLPFEAWGDRYVQFGRVFHKQTRLEKTPGAPVLPQPRILNTRKPRWVVKYKRRYYYIQDGWLFDRGTWEAVDVRKLLGVKLRRG